MVMKDLKKLSLCLPMALLALSGCSNDDETVNGALMSERTIVATIEGQSATRMTLDKVESKNTLFWSGTDQFQVFNADGTASNTYKTDDTNAATGKFSLAENQEKIEGGKYAFYPGFSEYALAFSGSSLSMTLPHEIDASAVSNLCNMPMFGKLSDTGISFTYMTGLLKLELKNLPADTKAIVVETDKQIAGQFSVAVANDAETLPLVVDNTQKESNPAKNTVTIKVATADASAAFDKVVYLPLPTGLYGEIVVKLSDGAETNPKVTEMCRFAGKQVDRKKVYSVTRTYNLAAETPDAVTSGLKDLIETLPENESIEVELTGTIQGSANDAITVPQVNNTTVALNLGNVPTTTADAPLTIKSSDSETTTESGEAKNDIEIVQPATTEGAGTYLNIDAPTTTATLKAKEGETTIFAKVVANTAVNTLVIDAGVTVTLLEVEGGNVKVNGQLDDISNKTGGLIYLIKGANATICEIPASENIIVIPEAEAELRAAAELGKDYAVTANVALTAPLIVDKAWNLTINEGVTVSKDATTFSKVLNTEDALVVVRRGGNLNLSGAGTIDATGLMTGIKMTEKTDTGEENAELTVTGTTVKANNYAIGGNGERNGTVITIHSGSLSTVENKGSAIFHPQLGTLTVKDGTISGYDTGIEMRSGTLVVEGGSISSTASPADAVANGNGITIKGAAIAVSQHTTNQALDVTIKGGTLTGVYALYEQDLQDDNSRDIITLSVTGGTLTGQIFSQNETEFIKGGTFSEPGALTYLTTDADVTIKPVAALDITTNGIQVNANQTVTLDLNGQTITAAGNLTGNITVLGTLNIDDTSENKAGVINESVDYSTDNNKGVVRAQDSGVINMNGGKIYAVRPTETVNNGQYGVALLHNSKFNMTGGEIHAGWFAVSTNGLKSNNSDKDGVTINISGGTLKSEVDYALYLPGKGVATIEGENTLIEGRAGAIAATYTWGSEVVIKGGTIRHTGTTENEGNTGNWPDGTGTIKTHAALFIAGTAKATITGGKFDGSQGGDYKCVNVYGQGRVDIQGGRFSVGGDANGLGNSCIYANTTTDGMSTSSETLTGIATVTISGGYFESLAAYADRYWVLNCKNDGTASITATGGIYKNFNPAIPYTDDKTGNTYSYLPETGYEVYYGDTEEGEKSTLATAKHTTADGTKFYTIKTASSGN